MIRIMTSIALICLLMDPAAASNLANGPSGVAVATGPVTLSVSGTPVRLAHVIAPAPDSLCPDGARAPAPCVALAQAALGALIAGRRVACRRLGTDPDGAARARCHVGPHDLAEAQVRAGWARLAGPVSADGRGRYSATQAEARAGRRGLWHPAAAATLREISATARPIR